MEKILLSLGTNLGDRLASIRNAIDFLSEKKLLENIQVSQYYETEPVGYLDQPWFLNIALCGFSRLGAEELLTELKNAELELGRIDRGRWKEREIDIDILLYGDLCLATENIEIPHPRMQERMFVLMPANDIASEMEHPIFKKTIKELLAECNDNSIIRLLEIEK
jgi:2-amino-4-hydroxy-6-hydroxymethyldihydropteridine diphosphokinase